MHFATGFPWHVIPRSAVVNHMVGDPKDLAVLSNQDFTRYPAAERVAMIAISRGLGMFLPNVFIESFYVFPRRPRHKSSWFKGLARINTSEITRQRAVARCLHRRGEIY